MIRFLKKITQLQAIWDDFQLIEFVIVYLWGFWVVTLCIRTPLDEKAHQRRRHCGFALWLGIQDSRPSALSLYRWHTTAPADSRSLWNTADIDPTGYCNICTLGKGEVNVMFVTRYTTFLKKVHTWDDVLIECDGITFIKHKEFTAVEAVGELLEVFVNASLQLVNLLAYVLMKKHSWLRMPLQGCVCLVSPIQTHFWSEIGRAPFTADAPCTVHQNLFVPKEIQILFHVVWEVAEFPDVRGQTLIELTLRTDWTINCNVHKVLILLTIKLLTILLS